MGGRKMTPEQVQQLIEYFRNTGELAVSKGFDLAMKQVWVGLMECVIWLVIGIVVLLLGTWLFKKGRNADRFDADMFHLGGGVSVFFATIILPIAIYGIAARLINPEWQAIKLMFGLLTGD